MRPSFRGESGSIERCPRVPSCRLTLAGVETSTDMVLSGNARLDRVGDNTESGALGCRLDRLHHKLSSGLMGDPIEQRQENLPRLSISER